MFYLWKWLGRDINKSIHWHFCRRWCNLNDKRTRQPRTFSSSHALLKNHRHDYFSIIWNRSDSLLIAILHVPYWFLKLVQQYSIDHQTSHQLGGMFLHVLTNKSIQSSRWKSIKHKACFSNYRCVHFVVRLSGDFISGYVDVISRQVPFNDRLVCH